MSLRHRTAREPSTGKSTNANTSNERPLRSLPFPDSNVRPAVGQQVCQPVVNRRVRLSQDACHLCRVDERHPAERVEQLSVGEGHVRVLVPALCRTSTSGVVGKYPTSHCVVANLVVGANGFLVRAAATSKRKGCNAPKHGHKEASGASNPPFHIDSGAPWDVSLDGIQGHPNSLVSRDMRTASTKRLLPTGECWCGCGAKTAIGSFFLPGHDKTTESAVISV